MNPCTSTDSQHQCGILTIGSHAFPLRDRTPPGASYRNAELIAPTSSAAAVPDTHSMVLWLDTDGIVTLITHIPGYLIESPNLYNRLRYAAIAIDVPRAFVESARCRVGDQLAIALTRA